MTVYVDNAKVKWRGKQWCHLVADTIEELHEFAFQLGLQKHWFQHAASYPHYDVTVEAREKALKVGAVEGDRITIITCARKLKAQLHLETAPCQTEQLSLFQSC